MARPGCNLCPSWLRFGHFAAGGGDWATLPGAWWAPAVIVSPTQRDCCRCGWREVLSPRLARFSAPFEAFSLFRKERSVASRCVDCVPVLAELGRQRLAAH